MRPIDWEILITATITILGWFTVSFLSKWHENQNKHFQLNLDHISRQIEELYGPLFNLVNQLNMYYKVKENIVSKLDPQDPNLEKINGFLREDYFHSLHADVRNLLKTKYHLIDDNTLPKSYLDYLHHSTQESLQIEIWKKLNINTSKVKGLPWPDQFEVDVKTKLDKLKKEYNALIQKLK